MRDRKTIFIGTSVHSWNDPRIFYKEAISLAKKFDVELHAPAEFKFREKKGVKIFGLPTWKKVVERKKIRKELMIRIRKSNANIFHFHDPELIFMCLYIKIFKRRKVIYDIHEDYYSQILLKNWIPSKFIRIIIANIYSFIEKIFCMFFDLIIFAESYYKDSFPQNIVNKSIDILNYPIININETQSISKRNDYVKIIYTGTITKDRGAINMVECLRILIKEDYNIKLFLVGYLKDENIISLIEADSLLSNHIVIIGKREYVDYSIIKRQYLDADIGLALISSKTHYENKILTKFYEYMYNEIPLVISNYSKWKKFILDAKCGICIDSENPIETANAVKYLIDNSEIAKQMGKNGSKAVQEKYNWFTQELKLLAMID